MSHVRPDDVEFGWFLPTSGDGPYVGVPPEREATLKYMVQVAQAAEASGYTFALIPTGSTCTDGWVLGAAIAAQTTVFRPLIAMRPGFISPVLAARMAASLDYISGGRLLINVVTGDSPDDLKTMGDPLAANHDARYERTEEFLQVVTRLWTKSVEAGQAYYSAERIAYDGKHYQFEAVASYPPPVQRPYPPLYFGGSSPAGKRVASRLADVYLMWAEPKDWIAGQIAEVEALRAEQRADSGAEKPIRYGLRAQILVRDTEEEAWTAAREIISRVDPDLLKHAKDRFAKTDAVNQQRQNQLRELTESNDYLAGPNLWTGLSAIRGGGALMFVGTPDQVSDRLIEFVDIGITSFILSGYPHLEEATRSGLSVIPLVRQKLQQRLVHV